MGHIHRRLHHYPDAIACYQQAIRLSRELGDLFFEASGLLDPADVHEADGDPAAAVQAWHRALAIIENLDHPDAEDSCQAGRATAPV